MTSNIGAGTMLMNISLFEQPFAGPNYEQPRRCLESYRARQNQRTDDRRSCSGVAAGGREERRDLGRFQRASRRQSIVPVDRAREPGTRYAGPARSAGGALWRLLSGFRQFGFV